jgi:hypothetical protein
MTRYASYRWLGGPQVPSGNVRKISPPRGFVPRTVQPVASCRTYRAIPAYDAESVADFMQHESFGKQKKIYYRRSCCHCKSFTWAGWRNLRKKSALRAFFRPEFETICPAMQQRETALREYQSDVNHNMSQKLAASSKLKLQIQMYNKLHLVLFITDVFKK